MKRVQSYSSLSLYKKCPAQWAWNYVEGNRKPPGAAADRGTELHLLLEEFFLGAAYPVKNQTLKPWQKFMEDLRGHNPTPEAEYAVLRDWTPTSFDNEEGYVRGKADLKHPLEDTLHIYDWKSGRIYPDHPAQGRMYMAMESEDRPKYHTHFVYLDIPLHVETTKYTIKDRDTERKVIELQIKTIEEDTEYKPTPSHTSCQWCPISWRQGGHCKRAP
jgi:hypothetical protein